MGRGGSDVSAGRPHFAIHPSVLAAAIPLTPVQLGGDVVGKLDGCKFGAIVAMPLEGTGCRGVDEFLQPNAPDQVKEWSFSGWFIGICFSQKWRFV